MPTVAMIYGILVQIYAADHNPPHIHIRYAEFKATYDFDGNLLDGKLPPRQARFISAWIEYHKDELLANYENLRQNQPIIKIEG